MDLCGKDKAQASEGALAVCSLFFDFTSDNTISSLG